MIQDFIRSILQIEKYSILRHKTWKDNITYELIPDSGERCIIQELSNPKTQKNKVFIENVLYYSHLHIPEITFWQKHLKSRFFTYKWNMYQVMKKIEWSSINIEDINNELIEKTSRYLAFFHTWIQNFPNKEEYKSINQFKNVSYFCQKAEKYISEDSQWDIQDIFTHMKSELEKYYNDDSSLPVWVIHWDPSFKNFLIDESQEIQWLIDYDMMSVEVILWDLADMIRSYLKVDSFDKKSFHLLIKSYNAVRKLSPKEELLLQNYCIMMILNTGFRYIISAFENTNLLWDRNDSIQKAQRCLNEVEKIKTFFI